MSIFELVRNRRAVFPVQYNDQPIEREFIAELLEAANWAPTHRKTEPWRFKVLMGKKKGELGEFLSTKYQETETRPKQVKIRKLLENPRRAGAIIAICMQRDMNESLPEWEEIAATAMAVQNMWLCCAEVGVGCYWSSPGLIKYMHEFFELAEGERCLGFFYIGHYHEEIPDQTRMPIEEKTIWLE
ncbi:nitroreductase [Allomuricauda sp. SCSIO 65647]|uniref:nitroreductase family protein n=1 Tax=Allomuricauda sp. SCSIO 65647 TaxID=2908843 RepID=UPI001F462538|nr:nitroreductase [Muricauda sp. SCSIO 65647]UJH68536.1 nitroreductase [Muricauda sp. SCSIO 65647]